MVREKYYQAILDLQQQKSIASISVRDIAKQLNITTGSLYYHFTGKNDLLNKMFCYYRKEMEIFLDQHEKDDLETFLNQYIDYEMENIEQFRFAFKSELANFLTEESILYSRSIHVRLMEKMEIDPMQTHKKIIVLGSIRSLLTAPSYHDKPDKQMFVKELIKIIKSDN